MSKSKQSPRQRRQAESEVFNEYLTPGFALPTTVPFGLDESDVQIEFRKALGYLLLAMLVVLGVYLITLMAASPAPTFTPASSNIPLDSTMDSSLAPAAEQAAATASNSIQQFQPATPAATYQPAPNQVQDVGSGQLQASVSSYSLQGAVGTASVHHTDGSR